MIFTQELTLLSEGDFYALNITDRVQSVIDASGIKEGQALVFYQHTTGAIAVVEHESGILADLEEALEKMAPVEGNYHHHQRGYDQNGAAHVRTALLNVSMALPLKEGRLLLGTYQEILMIDFDPGPKLRTVVVQVKGE